MVPNKNISVPKSMERRKKAVSSIRKHTAFKSNTRDLERAYLSSGGKTKSPGLKKSSKFDFSNKKNNTDKTVKVTPRGTARKNNLQLSVMVLTNELLNGKANGEYKMKSFQMVMDRILHKISVMNILLNKSPLELKEPKNSYLNPSLPSINEKENMPDEVEENMDLKNIKNELCEPV